MKGTRKSGVEIRGRRERIGRVKGGNGERLCIGCGRLYPKSLLIRIGVKADGTAFTDQQQKGGGRGIYLCPTWDCILGANRQWRGKILAKGRLLKGLPKELVMALLNTAVLTSGDLVKLRFGQAIGHLQR
ncbi:MAG: YlxR family protein [Armatimonadetes bacterium]|nr:YlxR family protein [Armatimonadota bacterium]MDW8121963.1 YlxR family protein [Armatimonadota bacterium]